VITCTAAGIVPWFAAGSVPAADVFPARPILRGCEARGWMGIFAPAGTPRAIIERLNRELEKVMRSPGFAPALAGEGAPAVGILRVSSTC